MLNLNICSFWPFSPASMTLLFSNFYFSFWTIFPASSDFLACNCSLHFPLLLGFMLVIFHFIPFSPSSFCNFSLYLMASNYLILFFSLLVPGSCKQFFLYFFSLYFVTTPDHAISYVSSCCWPMFSFSDKAPLFSELCHNSVTRSRFFLNSVIIQWQGPAFFWTLS